MKLFFASDIHGSTTCFRKLVNAGKFYKAEYVLMGGDLAGKQLIPLVESGSGWTATFRGATFELGTENEALDFERRVAAVGVYTKRTTPEVVAGWRQDQHLVEKTLHQLVRDRVAEWVDFAVDRLHGSGVQLFLGLGNDDFDDLADLLDRPPVHYARDGVIPFDEFRLASLGWSNVTPWHTHRELPESDIAARIDAMPLDDPDRLIFNLHVPPHDSGLDAAPRLDDQLQVQLVAGQPDMVPVGSTAVAAAIQRYQPILSLHGHIHEGRGVARIGRTLVINPGSEYSEASLHGALVDVRPGKVKRHQLVVG